MAAFDGQCHGEILNKAFLMLIAESFVMLNYPKTGSSFARNVIKQLYERHPRRFFRRRQLQELMLPNIRHAGPPDQHGCYCQIPAEYLDREVVTIIRNPYERIISGYEFRHWAHHPQLPLDVIRERFPQFPDLSIDEYIDLQQIVLKPRARLGEQTVQFIQMFFKQPQAVLAKITDDYLDSDAFAEDLADVTFLRHKYLNSQLRSFLRRKGFTCNETEFIRSSEHVNVTSGKAVDRQSLMTPKLVAYVSDRERLIFRILRAKGIDIERPAAAA